MQYFTDFWLFQKKYPKNHASENGQICNFASGHARDMVLVSIPRFLGMGNQLGPFSEASDRPEGQELGGGAVGCPEAKLPIW